MRGLASSRASTAATAGRQTSCLVIRKTRRRKAWPRRCTAFRPAPIQSCDQGPTVSCYYAGLAFNRGDNQPSAVFLSRFIDNNNTENGDPIKYLGTTIIDKSNGSDFIDKPWMAVDVPRAGAKSCRIAMTQPPPSVQPPAKGWGRYPGWKPAEDQRRKREADDAKRGKKPLPKPSKDPRPVTQSIDAGRIYVAYSRIKTVGTAIESRIMFSQSDDCGASWTKPVQLSNPADKVNQGANIAIDPASGAVYVAWRQFGMTVTDTDSVMVARMPATNKGFDIANRIRKFNAHRPNERLRRMIAEHQGGDADEVSAIQPFDSGTAEDRFRTNAYPTIAVDDEGRAYVAWTERGFGKARPNSIDPATKQPLPDGDARIVISSSRNGAAWTAPKAVDAGNGGAIGTPGADMPGHQLMPSISFAAGKLVVVYYDLREDVSRVFGPFIFERDAVTTVRRRHTIDIRAAYALKGDSPVFGPSQQVSSYLEGNLRGSTEVGPLQANAPGLPLFKLGTVPFLGDYIDIAPSPAFVQNAKGAWGYNTTAQAAPVFYVVWTDNRDVQKPLDGDWTHYTPVGTPNSPGRDPGAAACVAGQAGMRNQNIYSARLTWGLVAGSPGNSKSLDPTMPRAFVVFAQNTTTTTKTFRFTIASQPAGGVASFTQVRVAGTAPLTSVDVTVAAKSMVTRTVFATSSDARAQMPVDIREVAAPNSPVIAGGLASRVILNPEISNPEISNPEISNPEISNPEISNAEVYNPEISNPEISNPEISNPEISNPEISNPEISNIVIANPEISNPEISNPEISNPEISNPEISNPEISNAEIRNGAITDVTWTIINTGNTTASFNINLFLANAAAKLAGPGGTGVAGGIKTQLVVNKTYTTPIALGCTLKGELHRVLVANVLFPKFTEPGASTTFNPANPAITNPTVWLEPGGEAKITLRIVDPNPTDAISIDPVHDVTPVVTAEPKNTPDLTTPAIQPPSTTPPALPNVTVAFTAQPTNTAVNAVIAPISVHAQVGAAAGAGVQVTLAIAINPAGGHLSGTTTLLTDAAGNVTFTGLSIDKAGTGYRLSASASAAGAVPDLSVSFNIGAGGHPPPPPPLPPTAWTASGNGIVTLLNNGLVGGTPRFSYQEDTVGVFNGAWTMSTVATAGGAVRLDWEWTGFHSYCLATVQLTAFVNRGGLDVFTAPILAYNDDCTGARNPSAGFAFDGNSALTVQAGDTFGFRVSGSHFDGTYRLDGAFGVVVDGATSLSPYVVTNASDGGPGSLRAALAAANSAPDVNTITFAIPGTWVHTIAPLTPLPLVSNPVVIDGLSQPGAASKAPKINLDGRFLKGYVAPGDDQPGTNIGVAPGFEVTSSDVTIRGLGINRFPGPGVYINNGVNNVHVEDSTIGAGPVGVETWPANSVGVWANYSNNHVITRNVISSADLSGVFLVGGSGTTILGNRIGTSVDGLSALPNNDNGITMYDGATNIVIDSNVISGNARQGIDAQRNSLAAVVGLRVVRNTIGLAADGVTRLPNREGGLRLERAESTVVGAVGQGNVISGNGVFDTAPLALPCAVTTTGPGIQVLGVSAVGPVIQGNYIGTDNSGEIARPNVHEGIRLSGWARIGGSAIGEGNVISGNGCAATGAGAGVVALDGSGGSVIQGNIIGLSASGTSSLGNGFSGLTLSPADSGSVLVGGTQPGEGNVISGNPQMGVAIYSLGVNPHDISVTGNFIGTAADGLTPKPNGIYGVFVTDATKITLFGNVIATNVSGGVVLQPTASTVTMLSNKIFGNGGLGIALNGTGNNSQATPSLAAQGTQSPAGHTVVDVSLASPPGAFTYEFFTGSSCGAAQQMIMSTIANSGAQSIELNFGLAVGTWLTATATDSLGNTSQLAACAQVPAAPSATITSASPASGAPGEGFVVFRGTGLPSGIGDVVAEVTNGPTTLNGFVHGGPTTSSAVYVRLPFGMPLGAGTVRLRNNASTVVSNSFPIAIAAVPGTPVINNITDPFDSVLVAPIGAGLGIRVQADGIDTTGAVARFVQGVNSWDVAVSGVVSGFSIGMAAQVLVPGDASTGPISVSMRQGASAFSAPVNISVSNPGFIGPVGGPGGNAFGPVICNVGEVLTAITGEAGSYMGRFTMWCSPVLAGPSLGAAIPTVIIGVAGVGPVDFGAALTCPAGSMITGIHGTAGNVGWGTVVDGLAVDCKDVATAAPFSSGLVGGGATVPFSLQCPVGDEAIGFAGAFGGVLDRIGIVCANRAAPAPLPIQAPMAMSGDGPGGMPWTVDIEAAWFDPRRQQR